MAAIRYRGDSEWALAEALMTTLLYARANPENFKFGPTTLPALLKEGFWLSGDVAGVKAKLDSIDGLLSDDLIEA